MIFVKSLVILVTVFQISLGKLTRIYDNSTFLDRANTSAVKFSWTYEASQDVLLMALEVKATGWIGFGFAKKIFQMQGYDVIIGKVENGKGTFTDRHTVGYEEPLGDYQQDYNMTYYEEVNGTTTLEFHRKRLTGDSKDLDIKLGPMLLVYAYHSTADYPSPYKTKHDHQGYKTVVLLPWDTKIPQNITSTINPQATSTTTRLRSQIHTTIRSSSIAMPTSKLPIFKPLTTTFDVLGSPITSSTPISKNLNPTASEQRTMSLAMLPTIMPSSSTMSTSIVTSSSVTSSLSSPHSSANVRVGLRTKITNLRYEVIEDKTKPDYLKFKSELEKYLERRKHIWKAVVTEIRKGSVIVNYDLYMNTSSLQETQNVINDIHREIKKGKLGDFVVDPGFSMDPVVTMKVPLKQEPSSFAICTTEPTKNLILIIILGVAVGLLFIMFIVIIVLAIRIRKAFHRSSSYSLKPVGRSHENDVNY